MFQVNAGHSQSRKLNQGASCGSLRSLPTLHARISIGHQGSQALSAAPRTACNGSKLLPSIDSGAETEPGVDAPQAAPTPEQIQARLIPAKPSSPTPSAQGASLKPPCSTQEDPRAKAPLLLRPSSLQPRQTRPPSLRGTLLLRCRCSRAETPSSARPSPL